jgi:curved DNA-binding protein CbpA
MTSAEDQKTEMSDQQLDCYETLQISPNADPDTIHRVFRLLAQRYHPDNQDTGDAARFRVLHEAYTILSDPEKRAKYDARYEALRQERWKFVTTGPPAENDFEMEQELRCNMLEILYSRRRIETDAPALSNWDLAQLMGRPREHLEFTIWYLSSKRYITRDDQSKIQITAEGVDYIEHHRASKTVPLLRAAAR